MAGSVPSLLTQEGSRCLTKDLGLQDRNFILEIDINPEGERQARVSVAMHIKTGSSPTGALSRGKRGVCMGGRGVRQKVKKRGETQRKVKREGVMGEASPESGKATDGKNLVGRALGSGQALQGGAGRALSVEEDALVPRGQVSNRQGNTGSPSAAAAGGREQRGTQARWEEKGGWQGEEDSGEGRRLRGREPTQAQGSGRFQRNWREAARREEGPEEEDHTRIT